MKKVLITLLLAFANLCLVHALSPFSKTSNTQERVKSVVFLGGVGVTIVLILVVGAIGLRTFCSLRLVVVMPEAVLHGRILNVQRQMLIIIVRYSQMRM